MNDNQRSHRRAASRILKDAKNRSHEPRVHIPVEIGRIQIALRDMPVVTLLLRIRKGYNMYHIRNGILRRICIVSDHHDDKPHIRHAVQHHHART